MELLFSKIDQLIILKTNKINPKKSMYSGIKDNDKLLEILEEGTVYTYCNN